jgi:hypothetical protein
MIMRVLLMVTIFLFTGFVGMAQSNIKKAKSAKTTTIPSVKVEKTINPELTTSIKKNAPADVKKSDKMPNDFPVFIDTGNSVDDSNVYREKKKAWITANPAKYKEMIGGNDMKSSSSRKEAPKSVSPKK